MLPELTETFEDPTMTCYVAIDDIGVKRQKATRKDSESSSNKKKKYVENTVIKVMSDDEEEILTGIGMTGVFMMLLGFLLHNQLLVNQSLVFFTDGANNIRTHIKDFFGFRPYRIILDWYHLQKKCGEYLSMAIKGTKIRNEVLSRRLKTFRFLGPSPFKPWVPCRIENYLIVGTILEQLNIPQRKYHQSGQPIPPIRGNDTGRPQQSTGVFWNER